jgi:hypothetical protein
VGVLEFVGTVGLPREFKNTYEFSLFSQLRLRRPGADPPPGGAAHPAHLRRPPSSANIGTTIAAACFDRSIIDPRREGGLRHSAQNGEPAANFPATRPILSKIRSVTADNLNAQWVIPEPPQANALPVFRSRTRSHMHFHRTPGRLALLACGLFCLPAIGCQLQSHLGGQTLPSAYYLRDDIQYFPAGPEFPLWNQVQALEQHRLEQQAIREGLAEPPPPPFP